MPTGDLARVLVVIPTFNEVESLPVTLDRLTASGADVDVLVVDDASPDGTGALADALATANPRLHVMHRTGKDGLGRAYLAGFRWGLERGYGVLVEMDADGSHPPEELETMLALLEARPTTGLVIGSRWTLGGSVVDWPTSRRLLSQSANAYARLSLGIPVRDMTAGYRAYRSAVLAPIVAADDVDSRGYCFQIDMTIRTHDAGWEIVESPIVFRDRQAGVSKMSGAIVVEAMTKLTAWAVQRRFGVRRGAGRVMTGTPGRRERVAERLRAWRPALLLGLAVFVVHAISPSPQTGDSRLSVIVAWQVLTTGSLDLAGVPAVDALAWRGDLITTAGGAVVPFFPWPPMLLALPGALILALVGVDPAGLSLSTPNETWIVEIPTAAAIVAITTVLLRRLVLDAGERWSTPLVANVTAFSFAFTTIAWSTGSRALWQQTVSMLAIVLTLLAVQRRDRGGAWPWLIGVFAALALIVRPTNAVFVGPLVIWMAVSARPHIPRGLLGGTVVMLPFVVVSWVFYGGPLPPYYLPTRLGDTPVWGFAESLAVHLISPGRGLLIYVPLVILAVVGVIVRVRDRSVRGLDAVLVTAVLLQLVVIARFGSTNGFTYGPRLLLDIVPLLTLLAAPTFIVLAARPARRRIDTIAAVGVALVLAVGLFVNGTGAVTRAAVCWNVTPERIDDAPERVWDAADPPFLRPWTRLAAGQPFFVGTCPLD